MGWRYQNQEMILANHRERGALKERERWVRRMRLLQQSLKDHGHPQAAVDLEEAVDELAEGNGA